MTKRLTHSDKFWNKAIGANKEKAPEAMRRLLAEAHRRLQLIEAAVVANEPKVGTAHWGDVGSMAEVVTLLGRAGHYAGVTELTEE